MNRFRVFSTLYLLFTSSFAVADNATWTAVNQSQRSSVEQQHSGRFYRVDTIKLRQQLSRATHEGRSEAISQIELPVNNGDIERFTVEESPIMAASLAAKYPEIKSYKIHGIDNPYATGRISISPKGFHGMITDSSGTFYIDPDSDDVYRAYSSKSQKKSQVFNCGVKGHSHDSPVGYTSARPAFRAPGSLRVYRLAVATTFEYVSVVKEFSSNTESAIKADVMAEIHNAINRVNEIYENDLAIRLELVGNNDELIYTTSSDPYTDPYSDNTANPADLLGQNQENIDDVIRLENYDIGHVFSRGGGGIAEVGSVCISSRKAGGVTGLPNPTGEAFYIEYVAHEIGHQFSGEHTFNGTESNCGGINRWQATAYEPGGGSTIMSYAGICGSENIVVNAEAMFHVGTIDLVDSFTTSGAGATCGYLGPMINPSEPVVDVGSDYTIPRKTPFILTATGSDADIGDAITFTWDQIDAGTATDPDSLGTDLGDNSLFRSYLPQTENSRHFPALGTTLQNQYDDSENLPCKTRSLNFRVTVRDGNSGIDKDNVRLSVDNGSGPFQITSFNQSQSLTPGNYVINWDVANTNNGPVNCPAVDISLLTFNDTKSNYAETMLVMDDVTNDGSATVIVPDNSSSQARFKIQCSDNIFYDISDADLNITGSTAFDSEGNTVSYNTAGLLINDFPTENCLASDGGTIDDGSGDSSSGGGSLGIFWLFSLLSAVVFRKTLFA